MSKRYIIDHDDLLDLMAVAKYPGVVGLDRDKVVKELEGRFRIRLAGLPTAEPKQRFWINDSPPEDNLPWGQDTWAIVDEEQGGQVVYVHKDSAAGVLAALRATEGK